MADHEVIAVEVESSGQLSNLLKAVEEGGSIVRITRNGKTVAELTPASDETPLPIYPDLAGVVFNIDPTRPLDDEDWPQDAR